MLKLARALKVIRLLGIQIPDTEIADIQRYSNNMSWWLATEWDQVYWAALIYMTAVSAFVKGKVGVESLDQIVSVNAQIANISTKTLSEVVAVLVYHKAIKFQEVPYEALHYIYGLATGDELTPEMQKLAALLYDGLTQ